MLELLLETLSSFEGVEYLIRETKTRRVENYNIKQQSEMEREVAVTRLSLTLYVVFSEKDETGGEKKYRGSYNTEIHPGTGADDLRDIISQGVYAAGFVKNEYYPLVEPSLVPPTKTKEVSIKQALAGLQAAFHAADNHNQGHLSYSEFVITQNDVRIINSSGVDVGYTTYNAFIETAVHWPGADGGEIEIGESYRFSIDAASTEMLKNRIAQLFNVAAQKAASKSTPQVEDINILLSGECLATFFSYYKSCANARMIYQQLSTFKEGEYVQGGDSADRITMTLDPLMQGSSGSRPYDENGLPLTSHTIIQDGKLIKYCGDTRFASYLGITPTGNIPNMRITGGTVTEAGLRKEPYLELVSFSDFQANPVTGDFGSEIRLGFYFDGKTTIPVTGGSISGNISKVQDSLRMSIEQKQYDSYQGPATICLRGASISGIIGG